MSRPWRRAIGILLLILTLVVAALMATAWMTLPLDRTTISIDGDTFSLADLTGTHALVFFVVAVAAVVFALVLALAVVSEVNTARLTRIIDTYGKRKLLGRSAR